MVGHRDGNSQFGFPGWVRFLEAVDQALELGVVGLVFDPPWEIGGTGLVGNHLEGRGDGCHRVLNPASSDAIKLAGISVANPTGKGTDELDGIWGVAPGARLVEFGEEGADGGEVVAEVGPVIPEEFPFVVSRSHDPMGSGSCSSSEKTFEEVLFARWCTRQEALCVRGKRRLNICENCVSLSS